MKIVWTPQAADDLEAAVVYLAERNPAAAGKLATAVLDLVEWLATSAVQGPSHTLRTGEIVHGWPLPPFRIYYQRAEQSLRVVRIYHLKRKPIAR